MGIEQRQGKDYAGDPARSLGARVGLQTSGEQDARFGGEGGRCYMVSTSVGLTGTILFGKMGQVLAAGCVGDVGYSMLYVRDTSGRLLGYASMRPIRHVPRLCAVAGNKSGEEYVQGIAELATENASEAAPIAEEETEVNREVERVKRRQQTIRAECGTSRFGVFWCGLTEASARHLAEAPMRNRLNSGAGHGTVQNTIDITETMKATQAAMDKTVEALEEAEGCLKKGIRLIVVPASEEYGVMPQEQGLSYSRIGCILARRASSCLIVSLVLFDDRFTQMDVVVLMSCMRFQIPTYILRSKVDVHIRNIPYKNGFDSDREDATARESLFPSACERFIADT
ncbi:hypothetical protein EDD15DRAFT_2198990 [Pisolithus albus]|nr:hypothetical protein EDD15DRAFT_2198990 [Pisolithus albus]